MLIDRRELIAVAVTMGVSGYSSSIEFSDYKDAEKPMFKLTILYPNTADGKFDFEYYLNTHMPLSLKRQGSAVKSVMVEQGYEPNMDGVKFAYVAICHFTYESQEAFTGAFLPHAEELQGDIHNYTDIEPIIQFSSIRLDQR